MAGFKKVCKFCGRRAGNCERDVHVIDYKDAQVLSKFLTDRGKILPRRATGACARFQRQLTVAVKRARFLALIPYIKGYHN